MWYILKNKIGRKMERVGRVTQENDTKKKKKKKPTIFGKGGS